MALFISEEDYVWHFLKISWHFLCLKRIIYGTFLCLKRMINGTFFSLSLISEEDWGKK